MMRLLTLAVMGAAASAALGQADPVARTRLEAVAQTLAKLDTLSYRLEYRAEGGFGLEQWCKVLVRMKRCDADRSRWIVRWDGRVKQPGEQSADMLMALDQRTNVVTWVDHEQREWGRRPQAEVPHKHADRRTFAWIKELADPEPMSDQVSAPEIAAEPDAEVDGVACDVIVVRPDKGMHRRWWIGKEDKLPHRVEWFASGDGMSLRFIFDLTEVTPGPPLTEADLDIPVPEGYRRNEPPPPPPPPPAGSPRTTTGAEGAISTTPARPKSVGPNVGDIAPEFELARADVEGRGAADRLALSSLRGSVVVLDFWGSWNARCKSAVPELKALAERFKDKPVKIVSMTIREQSPARPTEFARQHGYTWPVLLSADEAAKAYKVRVYPTYFVIAPDGELVHIAVDFEKEKTFAGVADAIERYLPRPPAPPPPAPGGDDTGRG